MKWLILSCLMMTSMASAESAGSGSKAPGKKSNLNAQIFEKESSESSFTSQTKVIREVQGETQVFFVDQKGFFVLNDSGPNAGSWQNLLTQSQTKKFKVSVTVDPDSRQILGVTRADEKP